MRLRPPQRVLPALLLVLGVIAVYAPTLAMGPVCEDFQVALKGARVAQEPAELWRPFQLVWRPLLYLQFAALGALERDAWLLHRATQLALACLLAVLGWTLLRRIGGLGRWAAVAVALLWIASPLSDEVVCGENLHLGHVGWACAIVGALLVRNRPGRLSRGRVAATALLALAAFAAKEDAAVALPVLLVLQDLLLRRTGRRRALVTAAAASGGAAIFLGAYGVITRFGYRSLYAASAATLAEKAVILPSALFRLTDLPPLEVTGFAAARPLAILMGALLLAALLVWALVQHDRPALFSLGAAAVLLAPTFAALGQAPRWTFLPYLFFLVACARVAARLWSAAPLATVVRAAVTVLVAVVLLRDVLVVRGDVADWLAFSGLTRRLEGELGPLLAEVRSGRGLVVVRDRDAEPLRRLLGNPRGQVKVFFPRPDDPYGIVSLQAMMSWRLRREGVALERVSEPADRAAFFRHVDGGFAPFSASPDWLALMPGAAAAGARPVILTPVPARQFRPEEFP